MPWRGRYEPDLRTYECRRRAGPRSPADRPDLSRRTSGGRGHELNRPPWRLRKRPGWPPPGIDARARAARTSSAITTSAARTLRYRRGDVLAGERRARVANRSASAARRNRRVDHAGEAACGYPGGRPPTTRCTAPQPPGTSARAPRQTAPAAPQGRAGSRRQSARDGLPMPHRSAESKRAPTAAAPAAVPPHAQGARGGCRLERLRPLPNERAAEFRSAPRTRG